MSFATLMAYVEADGAPEQRVRLAAKLSEKFNATLIGFSALAFRPPFSADRIVIKEIVEAEIKEIEGKLAERGKWFKNVAGAQNRKLEWRSAQAFPTESLACEARSADIVVIGRTRGSSDAYRSVEPGRAVLKVGRPMLVVPNQTSLLRAEHVVIGWKDTREARRAVQDALPFLHEAVGVTIVEICASGEETTASRNIEDVSQYLSRHRIRTSREVLIQQHGSEAGQLIQLAESKGADLLVTGAYGHSRLGEWMFGGVTRDLLASSPICCLMSH